MSRTLLESITQSVIAVDLNGIIVSVNRVAENMFGYRHEEMMGQHVDLLIAEGTRVRHSEFQRSYFGEMRTRPMGTGLDLEARHKDGTLFPVEISLSAIEVEGVRARRGVRYRHHGTQTGRKGLA